MATEHPPATVVSLHPTGNYSGVAALREALRRAVAESLEPRLRAQERSRGPLFDLAERRNLARSVLTEVAEAHAAEQLGMPGSPGLVPDDVEARVIETVLDEVFGLAGLAPLLGNTEIENININGCDGVFVRYADGRRERLGPVASSDTELIELIRDLAARSGVEERRFDRGAPIVNFSLPDGERACAVMALTARPSLSIRRHRFTHVTLAQLRKKGTLDPALESFLSSVVRARKNVLVTGGAAVGNTTPHLRHTYRVTTRHGVSLRRGRRSARFAVASKACLIDHHGCVTSGLGSRDHRNALFCR